MICSVEIASNRQLRQFEDSNGHRLIRCNIGYRLLHHGTARKAI